ncbi:MAG: 4-alpha-glucanotransferase, partial [Promicromonosporaceae bacterium]|nr:4-alpha-glucanotransferase [Promicromonosporaceae bacterium]
MTQETTTPLISQDLIDLAHANGVSTQYAGFDGAPCRVSAATLTKVLGALGVPADTPADIQRGLQLAYDEEWRHHLPPAVVLRQGFDSSVPVHVIDGADVRVWVNIDGAESGPPRGRIRRWDLHQMDVYVDPRIIDGQRIGRATFRLPGDLPLGWHSLHAISGGVEVQTTLIVTPNRMELPATLKDEQVWGLLVQLYSVRSKTSWGIGDFADLADLAWLAANRGQADFVAVNPLAAAEPLPPMSPSPYWPSSRRFLNPMYLRVEEIPETAYLNAADRSLVEWSADPARTLNTDVGPIDRDAVWAAKKPALEVVFAAKRRVARQAAFEAFVEEQGQGLIDFATWCAITEHLGGKFWPEDLASPEAPAVAALREKLADRVEFYLWLQWVTDEQKAKVQRVATEAGMRIGIMHDLAVGVHPEGADAWTLGAYLSPDAQVGAPPDMYNQQGQNWKQPPWNPKALAKAGYKPYRDLIRTVLRHAGSLRADHILGLFRLWWIPKGRPALEGTYVA